MNRCSRNLKRFLVFSQQNEFSKVNSSTSRHSVNGRCIQVCLEHYAADSRINRRFLHSLKSKHSSTFAYRPPVRPMSSESNTKVMNARFKPRDKTFKTPYGHIAALEWGDPNAPHKILCIHGWLDNAGSFEPLIPHLLNHQDNSNKYHVVALDMPGVGFSSHRPPGCDYTTYSNVIEMRRVAQLLGWDKMILISHSLGAHFSFYYSCIYPQQVEAFVSLDLAYPITRHMTHWNISLANSIEDGFRCEYNHEDDPTTNIRVPVYSEADALKRLMEAHSSSLTKESAAILMRRGTKKQRWGYTFSRDIRLRHLSVELRPDDDLMLKLLAEPFKPNLLVIRAISAPYHRPEEIRSKYYKMYEKNCAIFRDVFLNGTHHQHMNNPEAVAQEILPFLDEVRSRSDSVLPKNKSNL